MSDQNKSLKCSLEEFIEKTRPAGKRSKLAPFRSEIVYLLSEGYSQKQVCEFLAHNDVTISPAGLAKFITTLDPPEHQYQKVKGTSKFVPTGQKRELPQPSIFQVQQTPEVDPADYEKRKNHEN